MRVFDIDPSDSNRGSLNRANLYRIVRWAMVGVLFVAASALGERLTAPVTLDFPDFPMGVAAIDLGQSITIKLDAANDGGKGVTWTCVGDACAKMKSTSQWATFYASGITGTATITATSIKRPSVTKTVKITVYLNAVPNMLCDAATASAPREVAA